MLAAIATILACYQSLPVSTEVAMPDWMLQLSKVRVPAGQTEEKLPNLGYTGLWRAIYGNRERGSKEQSITRPDSFMKPTGRLNAMSGLPLGELPTKAPRIRTAYLLSQSVNTYDQPTFDPPAQGVAESAQAEATFMFDHQLQQTNDIWSRTTYVTAPLGSPRDYVPQSISQEDDERPTGGDTGNLLVNIGAAILALGLMIVMICIPK